MTRETFLKELNKELRKVKRAERANYINHYEELIADLVENGMSEEEAIKNQGNVKDIAMDILANIEPSKLKRKRGVLIALVALDIVLVLANLYQHWLDFMIGTIFYTSHDGAASIGIIGGADGPTSIFIAGKISPTNNLLLVALIAALIATVAYIIVRRKRK